ncbi:MAG: NFACT family protein [Candidatus Micrarchaeaceae archaeon]
MMAVHEITALELGLVIKELKQKVVGSYLKKFYDLGNGSFRISFHSQDTNFMLYCNLLLTLNETGFAEEAGTATNFAIAVRKRIDDSKVTDIFQHSNDRIAVIEVQARNVKHRMVMEMFGKGNLILIDADDNIEVCYRTISYKDRDIRPRSKYVFPEGGSLGIEDAGRVSVSEMLNSISDSGGRLISELSKRLNIGPIYLEDIIRSAGLDPRGKLGRSGMERLSGETLSFLERIKSPSPVVYTKDGIIVDYSLVPLKKYEGWDCEECTTISEMLDRASLGIRTEVRDDSAKNSTEEIDLVIAKQNSLVKGFVEDSARYAEAGRLIFARMGEINAAIDSIKSKKRPELEELKAEFPELRITELSLKDKKITIEV